MAGIEGGARLHRRRAAGALLADLGERALQMRAGLHVHGQHVGARRGEVGQVALGLHDHQVQVEGQAGALADGLQDGKSHGDVGHEAAVHHVDVDLVGAGRLHPGDLLGEDSEVGGEDRRRDLDHALPYTAPPGAILAPG